MIVNRTTPNASSSDNHEVKRRRTITPQKPANELDHINMKRVNILLIF